MNSTKQEVAVPSARVRVTRRAVGEGGWRGVETKFASLLTWLADDAAEEGGTEEEGGGGERGGEEEGGEGGGGQIDLNAFFISSFDGPSKSRERRESKEEEGEEEEEEEGGESEGNSA